MRLTSWVVELQQAIRERRTHKQFGSRPVDEATVRTLLDLARYAPNHHLTQPWRFRILGPETRAALEAAAGKKEAIKLRRGATPAPPTAGLPREPHTPPAGPPPPARPVFSRARPAAPPRPAARPRH